MVKKFFHGIMFHHFHDNKTHMKSQGSISKSDFYKIIKYVGKKNILNADIFFERFKEKSLKKNHVCITFDDAVKSQIDIALPLLDDLNIKSFFFVYSSIFFGKPDFLEVHRYFRNTLYDNIDLFYDDFYKILNKDLTSFFKINQKLINLKKKQFPFYSLSDIKFRLVKNYFITKQKYESIMLTLFKEKKFKPQKIFKKIFFNRSDLIKLHKLGHIIGLHSHNHPPLLEKLNYHQQAKEYKLNQKCLSKILKTNVNFLKTMSHPCGSYNKNTLSILKNIGIELGFKQIMDIEKNKGMKKINNSPLEIARKDHTKILKYIKK